MSLTVLQAPARFDVFTLDGDPSPGVVESISGGEAKEKIDDQQQPLTTGSNTVVRGTMNAVTTYTLTLWTPTDLAKWTAWQRMFLEGRQRRPPRVYAFVDLNMDWVARVIFEAMTPQQKVKGGGPWKRTLTLHEYKRIAPYGGPLRPQAIDPAVAEAKAQSALAQGNFYAAQTARVIGQFEKNNR